MYQIEQHDFDGRGYRAHRAYTMPQIDRDDYWASVTDVPCPVDGCAGTIRWDEAGHVPGYRTCDGRAHHHFFARGDIEQPKLVRA